ncbi:uncharacterized protein LOC114355650 [Ostrinia furnacalis]|uniref:uncharacterized protein LOC114355650 n=1 Tax=Ostrinia furnacalis TaxID=93504 RepID=UPI00103EF9C5|nr:uncharacterized protein LOC114355650 [Ostrinia furnacalis]
MKLHPIIKEINSHCSTKTVEIHDIAAPAKRRKMSGEDSLVEPAKEAIQDGISNTQEETTPNIQDTPRRRKLKMSILRAQQTIKRQTLLVKRLRANNIRLSKKIAKMENIIKYLREKSTYT